MPTATQPPRPSHESLKGLPYEKTSAAKPPIPIVIPTKAPFNKPLNRLRRPPSSQQSSPPKARSKLRDDIRRDSGAAPSSSSIRDSRTTLATELESASSIRQSTSLPSFRAQEGPVESAAKEGADVQMDGNADSTAISQTPFLGILTDIPTGSFEDLTAPGQIDFSKRGSMLLGGKRAVSKREEISNGKVVGSRRKPSVSALSPAMGVPARVLSADEEALSHKVRSMYEDRGRGSASRVVTPQYPFSNGQIQEDVKAHDQPSIRIINDEAAMTNGTSTPESSQLDSAVTNQRIQDILLHDTELAGGIEDWENVHSGDVDRYGFIVPRKISSQASSMYSGQLQSEPPRLQRVSTLLQLASETPRRNRSRLGKSRSAKSPARSAETRSVSRSPPSVLRPHSSQSSYRSTSGNSSRLRHAANKLPHNKDRRCVDEAGDMLTLPPGLADIAEDEEGGSRNDQNKIREWERDEKWRKMAKVVRRDTHGGGMVFEFDTTSSKVIERTWKGIPEKWRATAWHSFLTTSAKKRKGSPSDDDLKAVFRKLLEQGSPDDVQIDIDVPRTISSHIMFRRRYRGGQRLLFRVLHCMSIYFPNTGYVQGMAALAATLLCYFDEEMTFVMLIRLWQLRGLEQLYRAGFAGLMAALEEFERDWLGKGEVATKLNELNISSTAYGTRWYLTLFNYSIPFPAQLRVWDVFMLLGDPDIPYSPPSAASTSSTPPNSNSNGNHNGVNAAPAISFHHGLDVLHACSAALIDGTRDIVMDSDFENAMKVLTSWLPVRDEEMLMRVARVEWKTKRRKGSGR